MPRNAQVARAQPTSPVYALTYRLSRKNAVLSSAKTIEWQMHTSLCYQVCSLVPPEHAAAGWAAEFILYSQLPLLTE